MSLGRCQACQPGAVDPHPPLLALIVTTALHLGFQLVVTVLVYPALADVPGPSWREHHDRHSRRITPLVVVVYGFLALACGWVLGSGPTMTEVIAIGACAVAGGLTAVVAAPAHGRLGRGRDPASLRLLLRADRLRLVAAVVALAGAVSAAVRG